MFSKHSLLTAACVSALSATVACGPQNANSSEAEGSGNETATIVGLNEDTPLSKVAKRVVELLGNRSFTSGADDQVNYGRLVEPDPEAIFQAFTMVAKQEWPTEDGVELIEITKSFFELDGVVNMMLIDETVDPEDDKSVVGRYVVNLDERNRMVITPHESKPDEGPIKFVSMTCEESLTGKTACLRITNEFGKLNYTTVREL